MSKADVVLSANDRLNLVVKLPQGQHIQIIVTPLEELGVSSAVDVTWTLYQNSKKTLGQRRIYTTT